MLLLCLGLLIFAFAAYAIIKKYNTTFVLIVAGILLFSLAFLFDANFYTVKGFKTTGAEPVDVFKTFTTLLTSRIGTIGLIIMAAGGFAKYMNTIGAATTFVSVCSKPLGVFKSPYVLLAMAYIFGQIMNIFIPSAAGLGMLLLVTLYPLLRKLNVTAPAAAAVLASTACLDLGPASGNSNAAANLSKLTPMEYFISYQMFTAIGSMIVIAVLFYFTSKYFDKKDAENHVAESTSDFFTSDTADTKNMPGIYALLPVLPLALLLIFSKYAIASIKLDVVTAMFISLFVGMLFELIRTRDMKETLKNGTSFFAGMADMLKGVVLLLVAAEFFASGLQAVGFAHYLLASANNLGLGVSGMTAVLVSIIGILAFVSGSGNAAFLSFSNLAPGVASSMNVPVVQMVMPMQLSAGIFRSMSPVAGVVIAISGATGVDPIAVVKRTVIPMLGGALTTFIISQIM